MPDDPVEALLREAGGVDTIDPVDALLAEASGAPASATAVAEPPPKPTPATGVMRDLSSPYQPPVARDKESLLIGRRPLTQTAQMDPVTMGALGTADAVERVGRRTVQGVTEPLRHAAEVNTVAGWIEGGSGAALGALMASNPVGWLFNISGAAHEAAAEGKAQGLKNESILGDIAGGPHAAFEKGVGLLPDFEKQAEKSRRIRTNPKADAETRLEASMTENLSRFGSMGKNALVIALFGAAHEAAPKLGNSILDAVTLRGQPKPGVPQGGTYGDAAPRETFFPDTQHSPQGILESPNAAPVDAVGTRPSRPFAERPAASLELFPEESTTRQASGRPMAQERIGQTGEGTTVQVSPGLATAVRNSGFRSVQEAQRAFLSDETASMMLRSKLTKAQMLELESLPSPLREAPWVETGGGAAEPLLYPDRGGDIVSPRGRSMTADTQNVQDVSFVRPTARITDVGETAPTDVRSPQGGPGTSRGFSLTPEDLMRRAAGEDQFPTTRQVDPRHDPNFRGKAQSPGVKTGAPWQVDLAPGATQVGGRAQFDPTTRISIDDITPGAVSETSTGRGAVQPPKGEVSGKAPGKPTAAPGEPIDLEAPPTPPSAPEGSAGGSGKGGVVEAISRMFSKKRDLLRRYGREGEALFHDVRKVEGLRDQWIGEASRTEALQQDKLSSTERETLSREILDGRKDGTPAQNAYREWWRGFQEDLRKFLISKGVRVSETTGGKTTVREAYANPNYVPQDPMPEILEKIRTRGSPEQTEFYGEAKRQGLSIAEADEVLKAYNEPGLRSRHGGSESPRNFIWPDKWQNPNVFETIDNHIRGALANAAEHDVFKYRDAATGAGINPDVRGRPQGILGDRLERIRQEMGQGSADEVKDLTLDVLGRNPKSSGAGAQAYRKAANTIGALNALRFYGFRVSTAVKQFTTSTVTNAFVGPEIMAKAAARVASSLPEVNDIAIRAGAVESRLSKFAETIGARERGINQAEGALRKTTDVGMMLTAATDHVGRLVAVAAADEFAPALQRQLNGSPREVRIATQKLIDMDYSKAEIADIAKRGFDDMNVFRQRLVELTQGKITEGSRIPYATTDIGRIVMQGSNFNIEAARSAWRVGGNQLFKARNPVPAAMLAAGAVISGYGISKVRDFVTGDSPYREDDLMGYAEEGGLAGGAGSTSIKALRAAISRDDVYEFRRALDGLNESQFTAMLALIGGSIPDFTNPPTHNVAGVGRVRKPRMEVLVDLLHRVAPTEADWESTFDRLMGNRTNLEKKIDKKRAIDLEESLK